MKNKISFDLIPHFKLASFKEALYRPTKVIRHPCLTLFYIALRKYCHTYTELTTWQRKVLQMANHNLAQDEPYLKHLDRALKEISKLHHEIHDALLVLEENILKAYGLVNVSWPKVTELFTTLECLKGNRREFDRSQSHIKEVRGEKRVDLKPAEQEVVDQTS